MNTLELLESEIKRIEERLESGRYTAETEAQLHDALIHCLNLHASITRA